MIEVKSSDASPSPSLVYFQKKYQYPAIQVVKSLRQEYKTDQVTVTLVTSASDKANPHSQSLWHRLPPEIILLIFSFIDFRSTQSIGKSRQQVYYCATFILNYSREIKTALHYYLNRSHIKGMSLKNTHLRQKSLALRRKRMHPYSADFTGTRINGVSSA